MRETLIHHKKQLFYLLSAIPSKDITESEQVLLVDLQEDIELQAELVYEHYIKGE